MTIRPAFFGILGVMAAAVIGLVWTRAQLFSRLIYLGGLLILTCLVWAVFSVRGLIVKRTARGLRQQLGQVLEERFEVVNTTRWARLWVQVEDASDLPWTSGSRVITQLGKRENRNYSAYTLLTRRGQFHLGPTFLYSGDPIGLFGIRRKINHTQTLLVLPYLVQLQHFPFPPGYLPGGRALRRKSPEVTPHAAGVREYAPGDSLNRIHWPITARRDKFMVKEFEQDPQADVWIFLDGEGGVQAAQPAPIHPQRVDRIWMLGRKYQVTLPPDTFEYAVSVAASISSYFIRRGEAVGMSCIGQVATNIPPEKGERQLGKILETLAFLQPEGRLPLLGLVDAEAQRLQRGSTVVMITPSGQDSIIIAVEMLIRRNLKPVVILVNGHSFGGYMNVDRIQMALHARSVPVTTVAQGEDIKIRLEQGFS